MDYVAVEQLDGDNKYDAGEHGLQVTWRLCASVPLYLSTLFSDLLLDCELNIHLYLFTCRWCLERKRILFLSLDVVLESSDRVAGVDRQGWGRCCASWLPEAEPSPDTCTPPPPPPCPNSIHNSAPYFTGVCARASLSFS